MGGQECTETLSNSLEFDSAPNQISFLCEIPSTSFELDLNELYSSILTDNYEYEHSNQIEENDSQV